MITGPPKWKNRVSARAAKTLPRRTKARNTGAKALLSDQSEHTYIGLHTCIRAIGSMFRQSNPVHAGSVKCNSAGRGGELDLP